jgi:hypothetical protein
MVLSATPANASRLLALRLLVGWALLLLLTPSANATIVSGYYDVPDGACAWNSLQPSSPFDRYAPWRGPLPEVEVDTLSGVISVYYPQVVTDSAETTSYTIEGVRYSGGRCSFCPYSGTQEPAWPEILQSGGIRYMPSPMAGPCFNGNAALPMACVQNQLLYPSAFVGEYYYPTQVLHAAMVFPWCVSAP